jgi:hypothetical protein
MAEVARRRFAAPGEAVDLQPAVDVRYMAAFDREHLPRHQTLQDSYQRTLADPER